MFRRIRLRIGYTLLILITAIITTLWLQEAYVLRNNYRAVSIRLSKDGVTRQEIENARSMESSRGSSCLPEITAWNQGEKTIISNRELNRSVELVPIVVYGDMGLTEPMTLICGNLVYSGDRKGCVIDTKSAYQLFGVEKAVGNMVIFQNKTYYIRGVVKTEPPVLLIPGDDRMEYFNLELLYEEPERGEELAGDFLFQNGLSSKFTIIDGYFFSRIVIKLFSLLLWIFFLAATFIMIRQYFRKKAGLNPKHFYLYGFLIILLIYSYSNLLYHAAGSPFYFPEKLLPSQWSDFVFWTRQYTRIREQVFQLRYLPPCRKDIFLAEELIKLPFKFSILTVLHIWVCVSGFELVKCKR